MRFELFCPRCGKKLAEKLDGIFVFRCPRCKSSVDGKTSGKQEDFIVTVITSKIVVVKNAT